MSKIKSVEDLKHRREKILAERDPLQTRVVVCGGTGCRAAGSAELADALRDEIQKQGLTTTLGV